MSERGQWTDATSYSRGERGIIEPRTWEIGAASLRIVVTRHRDYPPDTWLLVCHELGISRELRSQAVDDAQREAISDVHIHLAALLRAVDRLRRSGEPSDA